MYYTAKNRGLQPFFASVSGAREIAIYRCVASQSSRLGRREEISIILPPELVSERKIPLTEKGIFLPQVALATKILFAVQPFQMKFASRISFGERSDKLEFESLHTKKSIPVGMLFWFSLDYFPLPEA